jgi:hypothetical protein
MQLQLGLGLLQRRQLAFSVVLCGARLLRYDYAATTPPFPARHLFPSGLARRWQQAARARARRRPR